MNIKEYIEQTVSTKQSILNDATMIDLIYKISDVIVDAYKKGHKVLIAGNGGSAADAQHIAGELVSKFNFDRPPLAAIELNTNSPLLTAISNDYGYEESFSRQIQACGGMGDVFIAISTSGKSKNIIKAVEMAKKIGIISVGLIGDHESVMDALCDYVVKVPAKHTPIIQESQIMIGHIICGLIEDKIYGK